MDNTQPSIISVELSTDNILSGTLFDNVTGQSIDNHSVVRFGDNVTLKFETSERVMNGLSSGFMVRLPSDCSDHRQHD